MCQSEQNPFPDLSSINNGLEEVNGSIIKTLNSDSPQVKSILLPFLQNRGKRLRPALVLLAAGAAGYRGDRVVRYATLIELIHTSSLFHDDVIDMAETRRGLVSVNRQFGNDLAILAGDYLYSKAISIVIPETHAVQERVNNTVLRMTEGEIVQSLMQYRCIDDEKVYFDIIKRKTAMLFELGCWLGATLGGDSERAERFASFGLDAGLSFQMIDDLLDWTSDQESLGKDILQDLREGRMTLPAIILFQRMDPDRRTWFSRIYESRDHSASSEFYREIQKMMLESDIPEIVRNRALNLARRAYDNIREMAPTPELADLLKLSEYFVRRNH